MSELSNTTSLPESSQISRFIECYKKVLLNIIYFGLFLFIGGIYIFPNDSGTQQVFYLLITLPFLFLFPFIVKELPWKNRYFYVYMAFPLYMFASYFWAPDENIKRGWLFFFRQLVCFTTFVCAVYAVSNRYKNFTKHLVYFLMVVGFISVVISLIEFYFDRQAKWWVPLTGFSIVNSAKAGTIYAIHLGFCLAMIQDLAFKRSNKLLLAGLLLASVIDAVAIYFTDTLGNIIILLMLPIMIILISLDNRRIVTYTILFLLLITLLVSMAGLLDPILYEKNVVIRWKLIVDAINNMGNDMFFGQGLTYKAPIELSGVEEALPHTHNIFIDTLKFGGLIGVLLLLWQFGVSVIRGWLNIANKVEMLFLISWALCGVLAACFYAQQPYVRPGSYVWFFYWMPVTLLITKFILLDQTKTNAS